VVTCAAAEPAARLTAGSGRWTPRQTGASKMLLVVRHADAGDKRSWTGPDRLRPLSATGCRQAEGLVIRLEDYPVDRVLSARPCDASRPCSRSPVTASLRSSRWRRSGWTLVPTSCGRCSWIGGWATRWSAPMVRRSAGCSYSWLPRVWWPRIRWAGPRAPPGCWSAPTEVRSMVASWAPLALEGLQLAGP
jgi:hypothetical protein